MQCYTSLYLSYVVHGCTFDSFAHACIVNGKSSMQCMLVMTIHACIINTSGKNITKINSVGMGVAKSNETRIGT